MHLIIPTIGYVCIGLLVVVVVSIREIVLRHQFKKKVGKK